MIIKTILQVFIFALMTLLAWISIAVSKERMRFNVERFVWAVPYIVGIVVVLFAILTVMQVIDSKRQDERLDALVIGIYEWKAQRKVSQEDVDILFKKAMGDTLILNERLMIEKIPR